MNQTEKKTRFSFFYIIIIIIFHESLCASKFIAKEKRKENIYLKQKFPKFSIYSNFMQIFKFFV